MTLRGSKYLKYLRYLKRGVDHPDELLKEVKISERPLTRDKTWDFQLKSYDKDYKLDKNGDLHILTLTIADGVRWYSQYFEWKEVYTQTHNPEQIAAIVNRFIIDNNAEDARCVTYEDVDGELVIKISLKETFSSQNLILLLKREDVFEKNVLNLADCMDEDAEERIHNARSLSWLLGILMVVFLGLWIMTLLVSCRVPQ